MAKDRDADAAHWATHTIDGPFGQRLRVVERIVRIAGAASRRYMCR